MSGTIEGAAKSRAGRAAKRAKLHADGLKRCSKCREIKPHSEFHRVHSTWDGFKCQCKACSVLSAEQMRAHVRRHRLRTYGLTEQQFEAVLKAQSGKCAICQESISWSLKSTTLHVDHNHATGKVRGLLCGRCNWVLGHSRESIEVLQRAIDYLQFHELAEAVF